MQRARFTLLGLVLLSALSTVAQAMPVPETVRRFLLSRNRADLIARFEAITEVTPEEFTRQFNARPQRALGAGFNGSAYQDDNGGVTKFSHAVLAALGKLTLSDRPAVNRFTPEQVAALTPRWRGLLENPAVRDVDIPELRGVEKPEPLGAQPLNEELLGTLIWASYNWRPTEFPDVISSDGFAFRSRFVEGVPLAKILKSQREGTALHRGYDMSRLWRQVVYWQQVARMMLRDCGLTLDLFQPSNMLVSGTPENPQITIIDHALARPTPEAYAHYRSRGWVIPEPPFGNETLRIIEWPTMSQHITTSLLWDMNFQQAVDYMKAYYDTDDSYQAIERLTLMDEWVIVEAPFLGNYRNIHIARAILAKRGAARLVAEAERRRLPLESIVTERNIQRAASKHCKEILTRRS